MTVPHTTIRPRRLLGSALAALLGAVILVGTLPRTASAYFCVLAPRHGAICKYTDPGLFETLKSDAEVEGQRWAAIHQLVPALQATDEGLTRGAEAVAAYDSTLQSLKTPRAQIAAVFAAAFNMQHPDATVRLALGAGGPTFVSVGTEADRAATTLRTSTPTGEDRIALIAGDVARLAAISAGSRGSAGISQQLAGVYGVSDSAARAGQAMSGSASSLASRVRERSGIAGESEGLLLGAQGRVQALRGVQERQRTVSVEATVHAIEQLQAARTPRRAALQRWAKARDGSW
jgi:hypothetical protein